MDGNTHTHTHTHTHTICTHTCSVNFSRSQRKFCVSLHYNENNSFLFVNATKMYQCKAKNSEIKANLLCLQNFSKDFSVNIMMKTGLNGYV